MTPVRKYHFAATGIIACFFSGKHVTANISNCYSKLVVSLPLSDNYLVVVSESLIIGPPHAKVVTEQTPMFIVTCSLHCLLEIISSSPPWM